MKRAGAYTFIAFLFAVFTGPIAARAEDIDCNDIERLLDAIARLESESNPDAVGDSGRAIGMYQIHRRYWRDGMRILNVKWDYNLAFDAQKSRQVVKAYLLYYGRGKSLLDMARIHNGGPKGYKKKATLAYALRIAEILYRE